MPNFIIIKFNLIIFVQNDQIEARVKRLSILDPNII